MKKIQCILLVLCAVAVSLSHSASLAYENAYADDLKDGEEQGGHTRNNVGKVDTAKKQSGGYLVSGQMYFTYTKGDFGRNYEPYGRVTLNVASTKHSIWSAERNTLKVRKGSGYTRSFGFTVVHLTPMVIEGFVKEADTFGDDNISKHIHQSVNINDVIDGKSKTYTFKDKAGYTKVTVRVIRIPNFYG